MSGWIEKLGYVGQIGSPLCGAIYSLRKKDYKGFAYLALALTVNQIALYALKWLFPRVRPNGHSGSFPSGHTAAAFVGCGFFAKRYRTKLTALPCLISVFVGYSRYQCKAHWISDIIAGGLLGVTCILPISRKKFS